MRWGNALVSKASQMTNPNRRVRQLLLRALLKAALACIVIALLLGVFQTFWLGLSYVVGSGIVLVASAWFAVKLSQAAQLASAPALALAKLSIVIGGYALWFVSAPSADLVATMAGSFSATVLVTWFGARSQQPIKS